MKMTKQLISLVLCLMMLAAFSLPAFAVTPRGGIAQPNSGVPMAGEDYISCFSPNGIYYMVYPKQFGYYVGAGYNNARKPVRLCQAFLEASNCLSPNSSDGYFGPNTHNAIIAAQYMYQLTYKDGICGQETWPALYFGTGGGAGSQGTVGDYGVDASVLAALGTGETIYT